MKNDVVNHPAHYCQDGAIGTIKTKFDKKTTTFRRAY